MRKKVAPFLLAIGIMLTVFTPGFTEEMPLAPSDQLFFGGGFYYHVEPECPVIDELHLPMRTIEKAMLSDEKYERLRPCMHCMQLESEAYYVEMAYVYPEEEIALNRHNDYIALRLMDRDNLTFEDSAELCPGSYGIPDENDISSEEAIRIAVEKIASEYGVDIDVALRLKNSILCFPNIEYNGVDGLKSYSVGFTDLSHPYFYDVELLTSTGEVIDTQIMKNLKYNEARGCCKTAQQKSERSHN